ncbi:hypothetical protein GCM10017044_09360 [Kordiimonas sediminis]|uniref:Uncharacterized protein n=1 Tax=Kordiimonas sediminis TaxID=1735581 RepID=A0A919AQL1_9PROT|nr:hypothetical protein [Kordiimonas sediminis]GHF17120.1 hypothetical protein GCM10017044_09360 [Kordiimonas sediminis]
MSIGRFIGAVVLSYVLFAILYMIGGMFVYADAMATNAALMRSMDDPFIAFSHIGHLFQTMVLVWIFFSGFDTADVKKGAFFGLMVGVFMAGSNMVWMAGLNLNTAPLVPMIINDLVAFSAVGAVLAKVFGKPAATD